MSKLSQIGLDQPDKLTGRVMLDGTPWQYADAVKPGDLLLADFDRKTVHGNGGLYLVEALENGRIVWQGCRRITLAAGKVVIDQDGHGDYAEFDSLSDCGWRVVGSVVTVYRPTQQAA